MKFTCIRSVVALVVAITALPTFGAEKKPAPGKDTMDMKAMMEAMEKMGAVTENQKRLEYMVGSWTYHAKMWMDPGKPAQESDGTMVAKSILGGRHYQSDHQGRMEMAGPDGKPVAHDFVGMGLTGFNNMSQKYHTAWIDNMSTGIVLLEGTYDAASKSFTYHGEMDCPALPPGTKMKVRQVIKVNNPDQHTMEWYDNKDGKEIRSMEIVYKRK